MTSNKSRQGYRSPQSGNLGVYTLCSGPDPNGPVPGDHVIIVIYDQQDNIVRRLEQVKGDCLDRGYVDFFLSPKCRPALYNYHILDIDKDQKAQILATHTTPDQAYKWFVENIDKWIQEHGIPQ